MKRQEILNRLGYTVPDCKKKRVIIDTDAKNEADDQFAIMHHLLTPTEEILGIIPAHFEAMPRMLEAMGMEAPNRGKTMEQSYEEVVKVLELAEIDDIPLYRGSRYELSDLQNLPESEGADFIIAEARKEDPRPLYVCVLGGITNAAIALLKAPEIARKLTVIWIGGGDYPDGADEFNMKQDILAAQTVFDSGCNVWQIPMQVYKTMECSFAELTARIRPCGKLGQYLVQQMLDFNDITCSRIPDFNWPHGESWSLGDNPTVTVLLMSEQRLCYHREKAPIINPDLSYTPNPNGNEIRVYDSVDVRMTYEDMIAKLQLCYGRR